MTVTQIRTVPGPLVERAAAEADLRALLVAALERLLVDPTDPCRQAMARAAISEAETWRELTGERPALPVLRALVRLEQRPTDPLQHHLATVALDDVLAEHGCSAERRRAA